MEPPRAEVGDQQFGAVGLDHGGAHIDQFPVHLGRVALYRGIVAKPAVQGGPQGVHPQFRAAGDDFAHAGLDLGRVFRPADFVSQQWIFQSFIAFENFSVRFLPEVYNGHKKTIVVIFRESRGGTVGGDIAFDEHLFQHAVFFKQRMYQPVILKSFVDIDDNFVFA